MNSPSPAPSRDTLGVPSTIRVLAHGLGADPAHAPAAVRLEQSGRLRSIGSKRWMEFNATQTISNHHCAFDWRARAGIVGALSARDALTADGGLFELRLFGGIPLRRAPQSLALVRGQAMRYLAELAWAPDALLHNADLHWQDAGPDAVDVSVDLRLPSTKGLPSSDTRASAPRVQLTFDGQGHIVEAFAPDRPRTVKADFRPTPWRARFFDYREHGGRHLPFAGAVAWLIDGNEEIYWEGRVERWELIELGEQPRDA